jgi:protein-arginine kinase activator protein McsA
MDNQDIIGPYDRIELLVAGVKLTARPIEFEFDVGKNPIKATRYETTCPKCGNLIQFFGVLKSVGCTSCGATEVKAIEPRVLIRQGVVTRRKSDNQAQRGCPFIDPIEAGAFIIDVPE